MNYFIADMHLGHAGIIESCHRPFDDVHQMNHALIDNWNARVRPDDHVYVVGDFCYRSERPASDYLKKLQGHKHLIIGNHDVDWMAGTGAAEGTNEGRGNTSENDVEAERYFESVDLMLRMHDGRRRLVLSHYPMMEWFGHSYLIYGHVHNHTREGYLPLLTTYDRALNCCVEINGYMPVTFDELVANNRAWKEG